MLKGCSWIIGEHQKDKIFEEDEIVNAINWSKDVDFQIRNFNQAEKLKLLFDKWVKVQNVDSPEARRARYILQDEAVLITYEVGNFDVLNRIAKNGNITGGDKLYQLISFFCEADSYKKYGDKKDAWAFLNKDNQLLTEDDIWEIHSKKMSSLYDRLYRVCGTLVRSEVRIGLTLDKLPGTQDDRGMWYRKYQRISRSFYNEDFRKANMEVREVLAEMDNKNMKDNDLQMDLYLIGIDASIKEGCPDLDMLRCASSVATSDPAILLRQLMIAIFNFEMSRLNDIRVGDAIRDIEDMGQDAEQRIHDEFKLKRDVAIRKENREYLEACFQRYVMNCEKKRIKPNIEIHVVEKHRKEGYFCQQNVEVEEDEQESKNQFRIFNELRGVKEVNKRTTQHWMEAQINNYDPKDMTVPRLGLRNHAAVDRGFDTVFREIEVASVLADTLCPGCEEDETYMETFIEFATKKLQYHIGKNVGKKIKPGNSKSTLRDENRARRKVANTIRLTNGQQIVTSNPEEISANVIKAEVNAILIMDLIEDYGIFWRTFYDKDGFEHQGMNDWGWKEFGYQQRPI
jgi:hypothetical protein